MVVEALEDGDEPRGSLGSAMAQRRRPGAVPVSVGDGRLATATTPRCRAKPTVLATMARDPTNTGAPWARAAATRSLAAVTW